MDFAGEVVPLQEADVRERIDRELLVNTYWHSNTLLSLKRANRWFPVIEPILERNGVPNDFKYLALIESGLTNVISPAGATGYWQFMPGAAVEYGLEVNDQVDERYHVEKSTEAACKYLLEAKQKFGTWTMAAASYNMGMNGTTTQINRQRQGGYYDLMLVEETARYVFRMLAMKEILSNLSEYGFHISPDDLYPPEEFVTEEVTADIPDLVAYAESKQITYRKLKLLNPWLRETFLKVAEGKSYTLKLPKR
ncbi:MAG: lytic transglycosylase domain-containing protein [Flavobacteriales bacterium]